MLGRRRKNKAPEAADDDHDPAEFTPGRVSVRKAINPDENMGRPELLRTTVGQSIAAGRCNVVTPRRRPLGSPIARGSNWLLASRDSSIRFPQGEGRDRCH